MITEQDYSYAASESLRREHEASIEKKLREQPQQRMPRCLEDDLRDAIYHANELRVFLRTLHPDVKKIINFGELLNERV